ncbi:acyl-CoA dehydrogenase family protein [Actinoplanes sp. GCM10030250]|uniref:acyl-CoA dehydrogenase family protein n=1 Tax=Actinoplanes sp. GCM10030250 TaxID=3273376 RepID=UPI00361D3BD5
MFHGLDDGQRQFTLAVEDFCRRETAMRRDRGAGSTDEVHNPAVAAKMAELGWLGVAIPEEYGGSGGGLVDLCCFLESAYHGMAPIGAFPTSMIVGAWYLRFGNDEQKKEVLSGIAAGRVESLALSEPGSGSDVGAAVCRARPVPGGYLITGQKSWSSNAHLADHLLVLCRTSEESTPHAGLTMFQVATTNPGVRISGIPSLAGRELNDVYFGDCFVPASAVVGAEGQAWMQIMAGLTFERIVIAALALGLARRAFDDTVEYVRVREQFGRPVGTFQALRHRLADLATELECCRLLVYDAASQAGRDANRLSPRQASMAKLKVTETAKRVALEGVQMMGAAGVAGEFDMERHLRMSLLTTIYGGTSEIQREIIGKGIGL